MQHPEPKILTTTDHASHEAIMKKVIPAWKNQKLTYDNLSGAGGSLLLMFHAADKSLKPNAAVLKINPAQEKADKVFLADQKVNVIACALSLSHVSVAKRAEGDNWFVQDSAGVETKNFKMWYPPKKVGELLARV